MKFSLLFIIQDFSLIFLYIVWITFLHMASNLNKVTCMINTLWALFRRFLMMPYIILKNCIIGDIVKITHQTCWVGCQDNISFCIRWYVRITPSELRIKIWDNSYFLELPSFSINLNIMEHLKSPNPNTQTQNQCYQVLELTRNKFHFDEL